MLAAAQADALLQTSLGLVGDDETVAVALRAMREAIAPLLQTEEGVRVAEPGYLDRVAVTATMVGDRFDYLKNITYSVSAKLSGAPGESGEKLAESLWAAVRILARDGAPDRFREAVEGGMAAAQAFGEERARQLRDRARGTMSETRFDGRIAAITGGGGGMGRAFALDLAARGAKVAVCGRRPEPIAETVAMVEAAGGEALAVTCDVRDPAQVDAFFDACGERFGAADLLVNNAAGNFICRPRSSCRRTAGTPSSTSSSTAASTARARSRRGTGRPVASAARSSR